MSNKRTALGKGLSALLENSDTDVTTKSGGMNNTGSVLGGVAQIPLDQIEPNPFQPRTEFDPEALSDLASSIRWWKK